MLRLSGRASVMPQTHREVCRRSSRMRAWKCGRLVHSSGPNSSLQMVTTRGGLRLRALHSFAGVGRRDRLSEHYPSLRRETWFNPYLQQR